METMKEKAGWWAALAFLILIQGWALKSWVIKDTRPLSWDQSIHTRAAFQYHDRMAAGDWKNLMKPATYNYPPFYHLLVALSFGKTADVADTGAYVNFFFIVLLILSVFLLADELLGKWPAFAAAVLSSCYPIMFDMSRQTMIDYALTALVAASVLCLVKSGGFRSLYWSSAFGLFMGLAMLTKWTAFLYVAGPFLYYAYESARERRFVCLFAGLAVTIAVMLPWYGINLIPFITRVKGVTDLPPASGVVLKGIWSWLWYPLGLFEQINLAFVLLLLPGLAVVFWRPKLWPVFLWFVVSLVFFSLIRNRNLRYSMPALPAAAILSVAWLPVARKVPFMIVGALGALFLAFSTFYPVRLPKMTLAGFSVPVIDAMAPVFADWKHAEVIDAVAQTKKNDRYSVIVTLSNWAEFHSTTLNISARVKGQTDVFFTGPGKRWLEFAEFILYKSDNIGPEFTLGKIKPAHEFMNNPPVWFKHLYKEVGRWGLPDGSVATLYHLDPRPARRFDDGLLNVTLGEFSAPNVVLKNMRLRASAISPEETAKGRFKEVVLSCSELNYKGIILNDLKVRFVEPQILLPLYLETQDLQLLALKSLEPEVTIDSDLLIAHLKKKAKWLEEPSIEFAGQDIVVKGKAKGIPLRVSASLILHETTVQTRLNHIKIAGLPFPSFLVRALTDRKIPLTPNPEMPFNLKISAIQGEGQRLTIRS